MLYQIPATALIITVDSFIWVATCVVMSGPMLLSGMLETVLDARILAFLQAHTDDPSLSVRQRAQLLLIILIEKLRSRTRVGAHGAGFETPAHQ
jgi:hypothetical protein